MKRTVDIPESRDTRLLFKITTKSLAEKIKEISDYIFENESYFEEIKNYLDKEGAIYGRMQSYHKATHYINLLNIYWSSYKTFLDNMKIALFMLEIKKDVMEINSFITSKLGDQVLDLLLVREREISQVEESKCWGVPYAEAKNLKAYESKAYKHLSVINRSVDYLSEIIKNSESET